MARVCRTCLEFLNDEKTYTINDYLTRSNSVTINEWLKLFVPEMDLSIVSELLICGLCYTTINLAYDFKQKCLKIEDKIKNYKSNKTIITSTINLGKVIQRYNNMIMEMYPSMEIINVTTIGKDALLCQVNNEEVFCVANTPQEIIADEAEPINVKYLLQNDFKREEPDVHMESYIQEIDNLIACEIYNQPARAPVNDSSTMHEINVEDANADMQIVTNANKDVQIVDNPMTCNDNLPSKNVLVRCTKSKRKGTKCTVCARCFKSQHYLNLHMKSHGIDKKPLRCPNCFFCTFQKSLLARHIQIHVEKPVLQCEICQKRCLHLYHFRLHMQTHAEKKFACTKCNFKTGEKSKLVKHVKQRHIRERAVVHTTGFQDTRAQARGHKKRCSTVVPNTPKNMPNARKNVPNASKNVSNASKNVSNTPKNVSNTPKNVTIGPEVYFCDVCPFQTQFKQSLTQHKTIHTGVRHKCSLCAFATVRKSYLKVHMNVHTGQKFKCSECDFVTKYNRYLKVHREKMHANLPLKVTVFKCRECVFSTASKVALKEHERTTHIITLKEHESSTLMTELREHESDIHTIACNEHEWKHHAITPRATIKEHERTTNKITHKTMTPKEHEQAKFKMPQNPRTLLNHTPDNARLFKCSQCDFYTKYKRYLKVHAVRLHSTSDSSVQSPPTQPVYSCVKCDYSSVYKPYLEEHVRRIHDTINRTRFKCTHCTFSSVYKGYLQKHMLREHAKKNLDTPQFACSVCDFITAYKGSLTVHMRIHTGEKPYACSECSFRASHIKGLRKHMRSHIVEVNNAQVMLPASPKALQNNSKGNGQTQVMEQTLVCRICEMRFIDQEKFTLHLKQHEAAGLDRLAEQL